jgi:hypothetical protein
MLDNQCLGGLRSPPTTSSSFTQNSENFNFVGKSEKIEIVRKSEKVHFGQASFDSCYGSDAEVNDASTLRHFASQDKQRNVSSQIPVNEETEFSRQNLKLTLGVCFSAKPNGSEIDSEDDDEEEEEVPTFSSKRRRLTDQNILDLLIGNLTETQTENLFQNISGKVVFTFFSVYLIWVPFLIPFIIL